MSQSHPTPQPTSACSMREKKRRERNLRPRRRAVDCATMRSDGNHFRQLALRWKVARNDFQTSDFGESAQIYSLAFDGFGVVWICTDTRSVESDDVKHMIVFYQCSCESQRVEPFDVIVAAKKPIVKVPRINIDVCSHFNKMLRPRPFRIGASPRIGRASRSDVSLLTGSMRIVPNSAAWRKGGAEKFLLRTA